MRGRVACLNTDLSAKMKQIEALLAEFHSLNRVDVDEKVPVEEMKVAEAPVSALAAISRTNPLAVSSADDTRICLWITDITEGSAAAVAGLLLADAIVSFGNFHPRPSHSLPEILTEVRKVCIDTLASDKVTIFVTVQRRSLFGDTEELVILLYARACVNE